MNTNAYADAVPLRGDLNPGHAVGAGRTENTNAVAKEISATAARRREDVAVEESQRKQIVDEALDDALAGTFPASDPVALAV